MTPDLLVFDEVSTCIHVEQLRVGDFVPGVGQVEWIEVFNDHVEVDWIGDGYEPNSWLGLETVYEGVRRP